MIRRPPRSTLFPTRRSSDLRESARRNMDTDPRMERFPAGHRSEEHTSELQSPDHLVCRLLLEKKKIPRSPRVLPLCPDMMALSYVLLFWFISPIVSTYYA